MVCLGPVFSQDSLLLCLFLLACKPLGDIISASAYPWVEPRTGTQEICAHWPPSNAQGHAALILDPMPLGLRDSESKGPTKYKSAGPLSRTRSGKWEWGGGFLTLRRQIFDLLNFRTQVKISKVRNVASLKRYKT